MLYLSDDTFYIGYIGFDEKFRGGILKQLHKNCASILHPSYIKTVTLKPLSSVLTMWIYLGFLFENTSEKFKTKLLLIDYLKSSKTIEEIDIPNYDKMLLVDIVKKHKEVFKNDNFPVLVNQKLYFSKLKKAV